MLVAFSFFTAKHAKSAKPNMVSPGTTRLSAPYTPPSCHPEGSEGSAVSVYLLTLAIEIRELSFLLTYRR